MWLLNKTKVLSGLDVPYGFLLGGMKTMGGYGKREDTLVCGKRRRHTLHYGQRMEWHRQLHGQNDGWKTSVLQV